jgi:integral membrane protein (TIGR01906 family)
MLEKGTRVILIITLPLIVLFTSLQFIVFQPAYFDRQFTRYNIEEATGMEQADLLFTMGEVMDYLAGNRPDMVIVSRVRGEEREIFGERAIHHMEDVQVLFTRGILIRNIALLFFIGSLTILALTKAGIKTIYSAFAWASFLPLCLGAAAGLLVATNFSYWFVVFHELFFSNDLWILDPSHEILIQMLPEGFFADTALLTTSLSILVMLITGTGALFLLSRYRKRTSQFYHKYN